MPLHERIAPERVDERLAVRPEYAVDAALTDVPRFHLAPDSLPPNVAYQLIHDELMLDGNARLNLATFVTTWMEPEAARLLAECSDKNMIDKDEYPVTAELESRCVNMLADVWRAPEGGHPQGCSTLGSSEACMLGGLALKFRWRNRGAAPDARPNLVATAEQLPDRVWQLRPRPARSPVATTPRRHPGEAK